MYPIGVGNKEERGRGRWLPDAAGKGAHLDIVCLRASFRMTGPVLGCWVAVVISLFMLLCMPTSLDGGARVEVGWAFAFAEVTERVGWHSRLVPVLVSKWAVSFVR